MGKESNQGKDKGESELTKDFWKRIDRLEELAGKATQGEYSYDECSNHIKIQRSSNRIDYIYAYYIGRNKNQENDRNYLLAANPTMILEMIAEMRKLWRQNNWDVAALQAYGALPEDMEVHIENESFAWHLNRIKTGLEKRLEFA